MSNKSEEHNKKKITSSVNLCRKIVLLVFTKIYNSFFFFCPQKKQVFSPVDFIREIEERSLVRTDINSHLLTILAESLETKPRTIVELGTRGGESTFVLERVAKLFDSKMLCVDLNDCRDVCSPGTLFVQGDDIEFAKKFGEWSMKNNFPPQIDLLFIDTSHEYHHTKAEINAYFPLLSEHATVIFHDTNLHPLYKRADGTLGYGYCENIERDVTRAIEEYMDMSFDEQRDFVEYKNNWVIKHRAISNGLTVMKKI
jgi:cephalosporin hydroxylase